jgi:Protein of unknown function DUF262/Protein of unknown function (DUF1524)
MPTNNIGFAHKGIGTVLHHNALVVPLNQREYSWEEEHVEDLLTDFSNAIASNQSTYFLGTIVLTGGGNLPEVSDGQQRLATTTILLAAIRDYFQKNGEAARVTYIESTFLSAIDPKTTAHIPKLKLNVDDNEFFSARVVANPTDPSRAKVKAIKESHKRIARAAALAASFIEEWIEPYKASQRSDRLIELMEFVRDRAQVITLTVPDHMNAFMMFETLNDRGLKASQADLLKNHLLSQAGDRINEGQQRWAKMLGMLESLDRGDITVTFLHHVLITKSGPTREREVFDKVKQAINNQNRAIEFLDELAEASSDYAALFNSDHPKWKTYGTTTRHNIATINRDLRVEQIRPLMLAVARHFSVAEAKKAFRLFVFWSARFLIVGGRGGLLDRNYAVAAQEIGTGTIKTAAALAAKLKDILPSDATFKAHFSEARVSQSHLARYYLRALEQANQSQKEPEYVPSDDEGHINLEHILPENPGDEWKSIDPDAARAHYNRIGNMVLLKATENSIIGNGAFTEKRKVLQKSSLTLTSETAKGAVWDVKQIQDRQVRLAELAVKTWPLSS